MVLDACDSVAHGRNQWVEFGGAAECLVDGVGHVDGPVGIRVRHDYHKLIPTGSCRKVRVGENCLNGPREADGPDPMLEVKCRSAPQWPPLPTITMAVTIAPRTTAKLASASAIRRRGR